jgi:hypothetical protein
MLARWLVSACASTSLMALIVHLYGWLPLRTGVVFGFLPAALIAAVTCWIGGRKFSREVGIGLTAGMIAACAYDLYRVPFVMAGMPLFAAFDRFGELLSGLDASHTTSLAVGWAYHFSNGMTLGVMYVLLFGWRRWWFGVIFAVLIEMGLLLTPYPQFLGVHPGWTFIAVTASAHAVFGIVLGLVALRMSRRRNLSEPELRSS